MSNTLNILSTKKIDFSTYLLQKSDIEIYYILNKNNKKRVV